MEKILTEKEKENILKDTFINNYIKENNLNLNTIQDYIDINEYINYYEIKYLILSIKYIYLKNYYNLESPQDIINKISIEKHSLFKYLKHINTNLNIYQNSEIYTLRKQLLFLYNLNNPILLNDQDKQDIKNIELFNTKELIKNYNKVLNEINIKFYLEELQIDSHIENKLKLNLDYLEQENIEFNKKLEKRMQELVQELSKETIRIQIKDKNSYAMQEILKLYEEHSNNIITNQIEN